MPRKTYTARDIVAHVERKYGRKLSENVIQRTLRSKFQQNAVDAKKAAKIIHSKNIGVANLSPRVVELAKRLIENNYSKPPVERAKHIDIALQVMPMAGRRYPISQSQMKKLSADVINERKKRGLNVDRINTQSGSKIKVTAFQKAQKLIQENVNISLEALSKKLKLSQTQLQDLFRQKKVSFVSLRRTARLDFLNKMDSEFRRKFGRRPTTQELAKLTNFTQRFVMAQRRKDGRGSGAKAHIEKLSSKVLRITDMITLSGGQISTTDLLRIFETSPHRIFAATSILEKQGLIERTGNQGNEIFYRVTQKGIARVSSNGTTSYSREEVIKEMSLPELELASTQIWNMAKKGINLPKSIPVLIEKRISDLQIKKLNRKSKKAQSGIEIKKKN